MSQYRAGCSKRPPSAAAACEGPEAVSVRYVEARSDARTKPRVRRLDFFNILPGSRYAPVSFIAARCFIASLAAARALVAGFKLAPGSTLSPISATRLQCLMASCR